MCIRDSLQTIDEGIRREGAFYLFTLRLVPIVPFFLVNLLFGLTTMKARTFYAVSYTHLDVYKRQARERCEASPNITIANAEADRPLLVRLNAMLHGCLERHR